VKAEETRTLIRHRMDQARMALADARRLMDAQGSPMSIINRSYYAMFYAASAVLLTIGKSSGKHSGVLSLFNREFVLKGSFPRELGRSLHDVFDMRLTSDYEAIPSASTSDAAEAWKQAETFVEAVNQFLCGHGWL
jgi:uncharacterized protein (UPF0332 family)